MTKKKVFLLADIGSDKSGFYHVGDEAMFLANLERYKKNGVEVFASSRLISHPELKNHEVLDIYILNLFQFIKLVASAFTLRFTGINIFPKFFRKTVKTLVSCDVLHISGGGNITSLWSGHIYYRSLMVLISKLYGRQVILTSQSIGPIIEFGHKIILRFILNTVDYIGVRDKSFSYQTLRLLGINPRLIHFNYDDALFWLTNINKNLKNENKSFFRLGLSLHDPNNNKITNELTDLVSKFIKKYKNIKIYLIPHMFTTQDGHDIKYMAEISQKIISNRIEVANYEYLKKMPRQWSLAKKIRSISGKMDFVIASRYHGLVFALSSQTPCLAINYDNDYYKGKNTGLIETLNRKPGDFIVDFGHIKSDYMLSKFTKIYSQRNRIQEKLRNYLIKAYEQDKKTKDCIYRLEWNSFKI